MRTNSFVCTVCRFAVAWDMSRAYREHRDNDTERLPYPVYLFTIHDSLK